MTAQVNPSWKSVIVFLTYGVILFVAGLMLSGMGEGPSLGALVFGSPISATGFVFATPAVWLLFGFLLSANWYRSAAGLLIVHYLMVPVVAIQNPASHGMQDEWALFVRLFELDPVTTAIVLLIYVAGQVLAWRWVISGMSSLRRSNRVGD